MNKELFVSSTPHETRLALGEDGEITEIYYEREREYSLAGSIYKGRVTRVLPGMQSAFVDIGLERDAFLYVSDFFEDVEEYDRVVSEAEVAAQRAAEGQGERTAERSAERADRGQDRGEAARPAAPVDVGGADGGRSASGEAAAPQSGQAQSEAGGQAGNEAGDDNRRRRGRRRRGRHGRGGIPEAKFARPESVRAPEEEGLEGDATDAASGDQGESGEKFAASAESASSPAPAAERAASAERERRPERQSPTVSAPPEKYAYPFTLPGESLAKYRRSGEAGRGDRGPDSRSDNPRGAEAAPGAAERDADQEEFEHERMRPEAPASEVAPREPSGEAAGDPDDDAPRWDARAGDTDDPRRAEVRERPPEARFELRGRRRRRRRGGRGQQPGQAEGNGAVNSPAEGSGAAGASGAEAEERGNAAGERSASGDVASGENEPRGRDAAEYEPATHAARSDANGGEGNDSPYPHAAEGYASADEAAAEDAVSASGPDREFEYQSTRAVEAADLASDEAMDEAGAAPTAAAEGERTAAGQAASEARQGGGEPAREPRRNGRDGRRRDGNREHGREGGRNGGRESGREAGRDGGESRGPRLISEMLHAGQEILVQIAKEPLGAKGARITSHLALPGRFLVYMPTVQHVGVSRKIASDAERARLKRLILDAGKDLPGGFIARTAAAGVSDEELLSDIRYLGNLWGEIRRDFEAARAPSLLHHDLGLVERTLRDQISDQFTHIWVDSEEQYQAVVRFLNQFMPKLTERVRLFTRDTPMFEHFGIQDEIDKALKSKVWLKSGGYIVINQTEALVAIDVNTGKFVGKSNRLEDTIVKVNVDAIREIVRQIRLRDLGGIIVIDFIDMDERKNRHKVMQALEDAMRADRAPSKVLSFNDFGLVALTRKRVKQSLERTLGTPCPYCSGVGLVKSVTTVCNEIYAEAGKMAKQLPREDMVLRVNPEVAKALKARNARLLTEIEEVTGKAIAVKSDPMVHQEQFEIF